MKILFAVLVLASISLGFFSQLDYKLAFWQEDANSEQPRSANYASSKALSESESSQQQNTAQSENYDTDNYSQTDFIPNPAAVASLSQARIDGDPRTPELGQHHERETPTEEELGDHDQYVEYEQRQQKRVYRAFVEASKIKTKQIQDMIERGKAEGVSDEEIAFAEEKIRGIEEMAKELQRDYPDIMEDSYQPPADWLIENLGKEPDSDPSDSSTNN